VCLLEKGEKMSNKKSNRAKGQVKNPRRRRKLFILVGILISLLLTSAALAQWAGIISVTKRSSSAPAPPSYDPLAPKTEYIYANGRLIATEEPASATPTAPASLRATTTDGTHIRIVWAASAGATKYELQRSANYSSANNGFTTVDANIPATSILYDDTVAQNAAYIYRVRAYIQTTPSPFSEIDLATAVSFTEDPVTNGMTVKEAHLTQLRSAVNYVRIAAGIGAFTGWTNPTPPPLAQTVSIQKAHIQELRDRLTDARTALSFPAPVYTDPTITQFQTPVKANHIQQLRKLVKGYKSYIDQP
jgi:hypothetical protein